MTNESNPQFGIISDRVMNKLGKRKVQYPLPFPDRTRLLTIESITNILNKYRPTFGDFETPRAASFIIRIEYLGKEDSRFENIEEAKKLLAFEFYNKLYEKDFLETFENFELEFKNSNFLDKALDLFGAKDINDMFYIFMKMRIEYEGSLLILKLSKMIEFVETGKINTNQKQDIRLSIGENSELEELRKNTPLKELANIKKKCLEYLEMAKNR